MLTCKHCVKIYSKECPIRVWGRVEGNELRVDAQVAPNKDFCSRMEIGLALNLWEITALQPGGENT